jgi:uncharacterized protein
MRREAETLSPGDVEGDLLVLREPLSFWGGMDLETGDIIDHHHPQLGTNLSGKVVAMAASRGSSSSTSVLAEAIRAGTAPAAVILAERDVIVALGAIAADMIYGRRCPVVRLAPEAFASLSEARRVRVVADDDGAWVEDLV